MNLAEEQTCQLIENTLTGNQAYRKVDDKLYVIRQGSSYVMISVIPWNDHAIVRVVAQMVKGVSMEMDLGLELLRLNARMRFGAFAYLEQDQIVLFQHSILGGETLDPEELLATIKDVALVSDEWDDVIIEHYGGKHMQDLLEEAAMHNLLDSDPNDHEWKH